MRVILLLAFIGMVALLTRHIVGYLTLKGDPPMPAKQPVRPPVHRFQIQVGTRTVTIEARTRREAEYKAALLVLKGRL